MPKTTGKSHSVRLHSSETLGLFGTSNKKLEGNSEVSNPVQQLPFTEWETKAQRNWSMVTHRVNDRSRQGPIYPVTHPSAHSTLCPLSEIFMMRERGQSGVGPDVNLSVTCVLCQACPSHPMRPSPLTPPLLSHHLLKGILFGLTSGWSVDHGLISCLFL